MNLRNSWLGVPIVFIAIIAILVYLNNVRRQEEERPFGCLTRQDVRSRVQALNRISLLSENRGMSVYQVSLTTRRGGNKKYWSVDCSDQTGEFTGFVQWDADTGELNILSRRPARLPISLPDLTRNEAISHAWRLLNQPGIGIAREHWLLCKASLMHGDIWHVCVKCTQRLVSINIDMHTDQVVYLHIIARSTQ